MMKLTGLSHLFKWENLHNWWLTKYFFCPTVCSSRSNEWIVIAVSIESVYFTNYKLIVLLLLM